MLDRFFCSAAALCSTTQPALVLFRRPNRRMAYAPPDATTAPQADVIRAISGYLNKILKPRDVTKQISGMKVLLLDKETVSDR